MILLFTFALSWFLCLKASQLTTITNISIICRFTKNPVPCHVVMVLSMPAWDLICIAILIQPNESAATGGDSGRDGICYSAREQIDFKHMCLKYRALNCCPPVLSYWLLDRRKKWKWIWDLFCHNFLIWFLPFYCFWFEGIIQVI